MFFFLDQSISRSIKGVTAVVSLVFISMQFCRLNPCTFWSFQSFVWHDAVGHSFEISLFQAGASFLWRGVCFSPDRDGISFSYWLLRGRGSPERASFTLSCPTRNRSSSGGKLRSSGALTPPPAWKDLLNLIAHGRYLEGLPTLPFTVISAAHCCSKYHRAIHLLDHLLTVVHCALNLEYLPWTLAEKYYYNRDVCLVIWTENVSD